MGSAAGDDAGVYRFDAERALQEIRALFTMREARHWVLDRGLEHLDPATAPQAVAAEREALRQPSVPR